MLYKVVLTFESVHEVLKCAQFNEATYVTSSDPSIIRNDQQSHFLPHKK